MGEWVVKAVVTMAVAVAMTNSEILASNRVDIDGEQTMSCEELIEEP
jgi:hypothetical protein